MFITLEGIEGSGKSTLIKNINSYFLGLNKKIIITREPGATLIGQKIRDLLLSPESEISSKTELLLMLADREQHINKLIVPNLKLNNIVISDRYFDSTIAYQGGGRGLDKSMIKMLISSLQMPIPDLTFLIDIPVKVGLLRAKKRSHLDRFENEEIQFHERVKSSYYKIAKENSQRIKIINGEQTEEKLFEDVLKIINSNLKNGE